MEEYTLLLKGGPHPVELTSAALQSYQWRLLQNGINSVSQILIGSRRPRTAYISGAELQTHPTIYRKA